MKENISQKKGYLIILLIFFIGVYALGIVFFSSHFLPRTKAGTVSISELTPQQAESKIQEGLMDSVVDLSENKQNLGLIRMNSLGIKVTAQPLLEEMLDKQNEFLWPFALVMPSAPFELSSMYSFDSNALEELIKYIGIDNEQREPTIDAMLVQDEKGQVKIQEASYGNQVSVASLGESLATTLAKGANQLDLSQAYVKPRKTSKSQIILDDQERFNQLRALKIVHQFDGNEISVPQEIVASWIEINSEGEITVNQEKIRDYIFTVNEEYSARFKPRMFHSTYQGEIEVQPGTFGWYIDADQESEILKAAILSGEDIVREPVIVGVGYGQDPSQAIGNSYVEVDLSNQMMMVYQEGKIVIQTPIVSGMLGSETVPGAYQVWSMEQDTNLKGYNPHTKKDYIQPVKFWIAFDNNAQGIHDAIWQSNFGGQVYQQSGSLGCINTPLDVMTQVYEIVDYGWPVIVF